MRDYDFKLALNGNNLTLKIHPHVEGNKTYYDLLFEDYTLSLYKDTLYTWASDDPHGLSQADIQSIGEQIENEE